MSKFMGIQNLHKTDFANALQSYHLTRWLTLSCTPATTRELCYETRKISFDAPFYDFRDASLSVWQCKIVKVGMQDCLSEDARLTKWGCKIDCLTRHFGRFSTLSRKEKVQNICISHWISTKYKTYEKTRKNRRKTCSRKARQILRRFFRVKIVSYIPIFGQRLILF